MFNLPSSPFDRFLNRPRPVWITVILCVILLGLPPAAAFLDGVWSEYIHQGFWRISLIAPVEIIYILVIAPILSRSDESVIDVFKTRTGLDDESFDQLVDASARINPGVETATILGGTLLGLFNAFSWGIDSYATWLNIVLYILLGFMYALLAWVVMGAIVGTRLIAALHRQPLSFDLFDIKHFEPIGRQSLTLAMVFIGGVTLGVIFSVQGQTFLNPLFWLANIPFVVVAILVFYLGMRPTHLLFEAKKKAELEKIRRHLRNACQQMAEGLQKQADVAAISVQINALSIYEKHLMEVRTWPYNFSMLRTLFFSVLIPGFTMLARVIADLLRN